MRNNILKTIFALLVPLALIIHCANGAEENKSNNNSGTSGGTTASCVRDTVISGTVTGCDGLSLTGSVSTVAGDGTQGQVDGVGTAAKLNSPLEITTDGEYLYFVDDANAGDVRKLELASNTVSFVYDGATSAAPGKSIVYLSDAIYLSGFGRSEKLTNIRSTSATKSAFVGPATGRGYNDGTGNAAQFDMLEKMMTDANGSIFYAIDRNNDVIRKIDINTSVVTTYAGTQGTSNVVNGSISSARLNNSSTGVWLNGALYFNDIDNNANNAAVIRKLDLSAQTVSAFAGKDNGGNHADGTGVNAAFIQINDIATDGKYMYVADQNCVRKIDPDTALVSTLAGDCATSGDVDGTGTAARFDNVGGIVATKNALYVTDQSNCKIKKIE